MLSLRDFSTQRNKEKYILCAKGKKIAFKDRIVRAIIISGGCYRHIIKTANHQILDYFAKFDLFQPNLFAIIFCMSRTFIALIFFVSALLNSHTAHAQTRSNAFERIDCAIFLNDNPNPVTQILVNSPALFNNVECGWLSVPEEHSKPEGKVIKLGVMILKATGANNKSDPLIMMQGGPGGSTIQTYWLAMQPSSVRKTRDIVLFDQRGTKNTQPQLKCSELHDLTLRTIEQQLSPEETTKLSEDALATCHTRLLNEGVNLDAFDSIENASDVEALRAALGYDEMNLYGVSYGTLLALHVMRDHPAKIRSVVLDAVVPTQEIFGAAAARSENRSLTEFFSACAADTKCNAGFPNLEKVFYETVDKLNKQPARVRMFDNQTGTTYNNAVVDGNALQQFVFQSLYATPLLPILPQIIYDVSIGNYDSLGNLASLFVFDDSVNIGMYYSVFCAEDSDFDPATVDFTDVRPQIVERAKRDLPSIIRSCKTWNVEQLPKTVDDPVISDIPTLVLNGRFDPITPPQNGQEAAKTLKNSYFFEFPNTGHSAFQSIDCANDIVSNFLKDPSTRPDDDCVKKLTSPKFLGNTEMMRLPIWSRLFLFIQGSGVLSTQNRVEIAALLLGLIVLLSAFILLPLGWLARLVINRNKPIIKPPLTARLVPLLVILNALALIAFLVLFGAGAFSQLDHYGFLIGVPRSLAPVFVLPLVSLVLIVLMVIGVIAGWLREGWGALRKLYRGLLMLASIACLVVLALWGMVGAVFIQ
jgi:pimeloyl-ACP methyl ester carboxylesterase